MLRRITPLLVALLLASTFGGTAASAQDQERLPPDAGANIVGGSPAASGQFPFVAAVVERGQGRVDGFFCGASVVSPSWALTAAHCVLDYDERYPDATYGPFVAPSYFDVVTGTNVIASGGQRLQVASIHAHPSFRVTGNDYDVALLRLRRPTSSPAISVIGSSASELALDDAGTNATVAGWGVTQNGQPAPTPTLRYVGVPVHTNDTCSASYYPGLADPRGFPLEYHGSNMLCAGPMSGGKDACKGDSGGPLAVQAGDGSWRQIGVVSFGADCALPGYPGVYHRLTSSAAWIGQTRRFGPFAPDGFAFVAQQYRDFTGRGPNASQLITWLQRLQTQPPADLIAAHVASPAWDANAGMNTRLYRAAFGRNPDTSGLRFWISQRWAGRGPVSIADHFTASSEFRSTYGSLSDDAFVTLIYQNVFDRAPDSGGRSYWLGKLAGGRGRGQMLYELSNSSEYRTKTQTLVRITTTRFALLGQAPSAGEITASQALSQRALIDSLRMSLRYASRVSS